jgi:putative transposase
LRFAGADLSPEAKRRLSWIDWYNSHEKNARKTCRHFSISPDTFYRAFKRYEPYDLTTLESKSHRPRHLRQPTWSREIEQAVLKLREQYPRWGKDKLVVLLHKDYPELSTSMVGRILKKLKDRGILREPLRHGISVHKRCWQRPYAVRKPKEYQATHPGDLVEVDTLDVRPYHGLILKHFTARDVVSRYDVLEVHRQAKASTAAHFLDTLQCRMPFPIRAIQVDGGSEFQAEFEDECQKRKLLLYVLPPRSPKLNGSVERAQRTHTEEFYELYDKELEIEPLNVALQGWERVYNFIRPHQALRYLTPAQFLAGQDAVLLSTSPTAAHKPK